MTPRHVVITFDYEGSWGMPQPFDYDLAKTTDRLLELLDQADAKAVFFVTAQLITEYPGVIQNIHRHGHEIGIHGLTHEHMHQLTAAGIARFGAELSPILDQAEQLIGYRPRGFRAPYLMGPVFYDHRVYQALKDLGFTWISNREIRMPEELFLPGRLPFGLSLLRLRPLRRLALAALNTGIIRRERPVGGSWWSTIRWLWANPVPFERPEGLIEYPLTSPLDCDLLGFPNPATPASAAALNLAKYTLRACFTASSAPFVVSCHDWISGTSNRSEVLQTILKDVNETGNIRYFRPGIDPS